MAHSSPLDTLADTKDELLVLGTLVREVLMESIGALHHPGTIVYRRLVARHLEIERKRAEIEAACLLRIATRQITSAETRCLAAALEIAAELERIAYLVRDLARAPLTGVPEFSAQASDLVPIIEEAMGHLDQALQALALGDQALAQQDHRPADRINQVYAYLYRRFAESEEPATVLEPAQLRLLLRMVQDHRQIADRIDSVCAWVRFALTEPDQKIIQEGLG